MDLGDAERREQIDRCFRERDRCFEPIGELKVFLRADLMRETAHHCRDGMDRAPAHERAKIVAELLQIERLVEQFRV